MSRNSQGLYTLPLPPVRPAELIESAWANTTMDDIASALTGSLPRDGSAPMVGPLILSNDPITASRQATSKAYVDSFMAFASGLPVGSVVAFAGINIPAGYFECNGQAISRTLYASLFTAIGVTYGSGDGSTTFNVPDMRDEFIRGKSDSRAVGNKQAASFAAHTHTINDPGHAHTASQNSHSHGLNAHTHGVSDPGHSHGNVFNGAYERESGGTGGWGAIYPNGVTNSAATGISIQAAGDFGMSAAQPNVSVASAITGLTNGAAGGDETRPQNIAQIYIIKAVNDASGPATLTGIATSDAQMISVDNTNPVVPELVIHSNVAFGMVKLDASGQIPLNLLPTGSQQLLGYWDASGGQTPSQASPSTDYASGDTYIISVTGTLTVYDPVTLTASPTVVAVGSLLQYVENSVTNPTGWYYVVQSATVVASQVAFTPTGTIGATNVQGAIAELDTETQAGLATLNSTKQDNLPPQGSAIGKFLSTDGSNPVWETVDALPDQTGHDGEFLTTDGTDAAWTPVQSNSTPLGLFEHANTITANYAIATGNNAGSFGPITVANGAEVTVPNGSTWSVV